MVNDSRYPPSDQSVCQQMSVPLTYDDGISLLTKRCDKDEAYFACDIPCKLLCIFDHQEKRATFHKKLSVLVEKNTLTNNVIGDSLSKIEVKLTITLSREKIL